MKLTLAKLTSEINAFTVLGYAVIAALAVAYIEDPQAFILTFLCACCYSIFLNRRHLNTVSLLAILLFVKLAELAVVSFVTQTNNNYVIFSSFFLIDIPAVILTALRVPACRMIEYQATNAIKDPDIYTITNADLIVGRIYIIYCFINLLALLEHALRHLEHFGFPVDAPYTIYLYENFRLIWENYEYLKHTLNLVEFIAVLATVSNYMRSARFLRA